MLRPSRPPVEIEAEVIVPSVWRGWGWPQHITVKWEEDGVAYTVKGTMTDDGPVLTDVHLAGVIETHHLRGPFMSVMRNGFAKAALGPERLGGGYSRKSGTKIRVPVGVGRPVDSTSARQRIDELARVWKQAPARAKGRTVAEHFKISRGYAAILIGEARRKGLLDDPS
jgi:hypothetical protein